MQFWKATVLATLVLGAPATALAETVLTLHMEEQSAWVRNFNPYNLGSRRASTIDLIYEPLVIFNPMEGGKAYYRLATGFSFSDDLKAITYTLRDGVKWSDGQPFTAEDVKYSIDLARGNPAVDAYGMADAVTSVEVVDPHKVTIHLKDVDSTFPETFSDVPIVPKHVWSAIPDPVATANENPVGTGPMTEIRRFTTQVYEQCRNPNYWDAASLKIDCLKFPQIAGNDNTLAVAQSGELDWFGSFLPDIEKTYVAKDPANHHYWQPPAETVSLMFNLKTETEGNREAFNDLAFRQAVSLAMDRDSMVNVAGYGYPTANDHASGLPPRFADWRSKTDSAQWDAFLHYDVEKAKAVLDQAGYKPGADGMRTTPSGKPISFKILVPNGWTDWIDDAQIAIEGLRAIGIDAGVETPELEQRTTAMLAGSFDAGLGSTLDGATPFKFYNDTYNSKSGGRVEGGSARYDNPELDAALAAFRTTTDSARQHELMSKVQDIVSANLPVVPLFNNPTWYQYSTKRFTGWATPDKPFAVPENHDGVHTRILHLLALRPVQ